MIGEEKKSEVRIVGEPEEEEERGERKRRKKRGMSRETGRPGREESG